MSMQNIKKVAAGVGLAILTVLGAGTIAGSTAQAQCVRRPLPPAPVYYRNQPYYNTGYNNGGYYNNGYNNGYYAAQRDKGFRDGYDRGREDAEDHRYPNPNNSEHFRNGNPAYRDGFRYGYQRGYREYTRYRR